MACLRFQYFKIYSKLDHNKISLLLLNHQIILSVKKVKKHSGRIFFNDNLHIDQVSMVMVQTLKYGLQATHEFSK